jgi:large repetitive protein
MTEATSPRVSGPALTWPVRESFLAYVTSTGGRITIVEPAYPGTRGFAFPHAPAAGHAGGAGPAADSGGGRTGELAFTGGVAFSSHGGELDITLAEPVLVFDDQGALLTVADPVRPGGGIRAVIAVLAGQPHAGTRETAALVPLLTEDGSALFGGVYPPGEAMDPLFVPGGLLATVSHPLSGLDGYR